MAPSDCANVRPTGSGVWAHPARAALAALLLATAPAVAQPVAQTGGIAGFVTDEASGEALEGTTVVLTGPIGSEPSQQLRSTGADGRFAFETVRAGTYRLDFTRAGYQAASIAELAVRPGQESRADQALSARAGEESQAQPATGPIEELTVHGDPAKDLLSSIETRSESDQLVNVLGAEDLSKYAAVDMADALKRVAGVNVVEGQFAIVRGLEDRYSSVLYNSAPVPSPDPDRQSPQLDLFPAEVVEKVVVAKTFGPELPSNSSGGSIDIVTGGYLEEFEAKAKVKGGFNENAVDRFLEFEEGSPVGIEHGGLDDTWTSEAGGYLGTRQEVLGREVRFKVLGNFDSDYETEEGFQEDREPRARQASPPFGDLVDGELSLTAGRFDLTTSEHAEQGTAYAGLGFDLDELSEHTIDLSVFWTNKDEETVQLKENGFLSGYDYLRPGGPVEVENNPGSGEITFETQFDGTVAGGPGNASLSSWITKTRNATNDSPSRGPLWLSSFMESKSFETKRNLFVPQINGDHELEVLLSGLHLSWVTNYARTTQDEEALGARMWYEPCGYSEDPLLRCPAGAGRVVPVPTVFPVTVTALGPGKYVATTEIFSSANDIEETQWFGRADLEYETPPIADWFEAALRTGIWMERSEREVEASYLQTLDAQLDNVNCPFSICGGSDRSGPNVFADSLPQLGRNLFSIAYPAHLQPIREAQSEGTREIDALNLGVKTTFWDDFDLLGGVRLEQLTIEMDNEPYITNDIQGQFEIDQTPAIFPSKYLLFDRLDNPEREPFRSPPYNDEILGLELPVGPCRAASGPGVEPPPGPAPGLEGQTCVDLVSRAEIDALVDGEIDEELVLPSVALAYRPIRGLALRGAYSQTTARPSFREMGYYASVEPASDDIIVGNPQLQLSDVESYDLRAEYVYGNYSDLFAVSGFHKKIEDPIESIIVRNPVDALESFSQALFRTWFNNPSEATVWGFELEARKNLGFLAFERDELFFLEYFTVGGNGTWIDATVDRTPGELRRAEQFFPAGGATTLEDSRRLYGQPEWVANADVSFEQLAWGTSVTLAYYAISDVLDAAGAATIGRNNQVVGITLDRYIASYHALDLVVSQKIWDGLAIKLSAKNLTDSRRRVIYDPAEVHGEIPERSFRVGRDYSLELSYTFSELPDFGLPALFHAE